jgi:YesN/AraC family two-component response regulator
MLKVLIADDSPPVCERLSALISELGGIHLVGQARDGPEALSAIQHLRPDVAILDVRMPGCSGVQILEALKRAGHAPVVIMLTAFPYPQYRKRCLEAGAEYFFDKTTEFCRVSEVLERLRDERGGLQYG